jgi:quercetin dioxygenase-like cupin family protein
VTPGPDSTHSLPTWTVEEPLRIEYFLARAEDAAWEPCPSDAVEVRVLGLDEATGGALGARHVRRRPASAAHEGSWLTADESFRFLFVLSGSVVSELGDATKTTVSSGGIAWLPGGVRHRESGWSPDYEALEITSPASPEAVAGGGNSPAEAKYLHDSPDAHVADNRLRSFFVYRDVVPGNWTEDRVLIQQMTVNSTPDGGTGWHYHSMSQLFYVTHGTVEIGVEDEGTLHLNKGDAMCIPAGRVHNVSEFSPDYALVEVCVPAVYTTTPTTAPQL